MKRSDDIPDKPISRRSFLSLSLAATGAVILSACGGSAGQTPSTSSSPPPAKPTTAGNPSLAQEPTSVTGGSTPSRGAGQPAATAPAQQTSILSSASTPSVIATVKAPEQMNEAPSLASMVQQGKLPAVKQRLPKDPLVVRPLQQTGKYGGAIHMATTVGSASQLLINARVGLVEFAPGSSEVVPGLAKSWETSDGGKVYTFHLREGLKWSDGKPFSADDLEFYYKDMLQNKDLTTVFPTWLMSGDKPVKIEKVDQNTVRFKFVAPNGLLLRQLSYHGAFQGSILHPKHYLSQFHPSYASKADLQAKMKSGGYKQWTDLFLAKDSIADNPDRPVMGPWQLTQPLTAKTTRMQAERNPYYYKVDTEGNQLPYVDSLIADKLDQNVIVLRAANGDLDLQFESLSVSDLPVFLKGEKQGGYKILHWESDAPFIAMYMNQSHKDPVMRKLMQNVDFRHALSVAINREEMNQAMYAGQGGKQQPCAIPQDPYYVKGYGYNFTDYDPKTANQLLDKAGLDKKDSQGNRLRPDGKQLQLTITTFTYEYGGAASATDAYEYVKKYWEAVGVGTTVKNVAGDLWGVKATGNELDIPGYTVAGLLWDADPLWYVPVSHNTYWAPAYGEWYATGGKQGAKPPEPYRKLQKMYDQMKSEIDEEKRIKLGQQILKQHNDNVYMIGTVTTPFTPVIASNDFVNFLDKAVLSYRLQFAATTWLEQVSYRNPEKH